MEKTTVESLLKLLTVAAKWLRPPYTGYLADFCEKVLLEERQVDPRETWNFARGSLYELIIRIGRFDLFNYQDSEALSHLARWLWPGSAEADPLGQLRAFDLRYQFRFPEKRQAALAFLEIAFASDRLPEK